MALPSQAGVVGVSYPREPVYLNSRLLFASWAQSMSRSLQGPHLIYMLELTKP